MAQYAPNPQMEKIAYTPSLAEIMNVKLRQISPKRDRDGVEKYVAKQMIRPKRVQKKDRKYKDPFFDMLDMAKKMAGIVDVSDEMFTSMDLSDPEPIKKPEEMGPILGNSVGLSANA